MKMVVGLGNPGTRYAATRHNIGARIVDQFAVDRGVALSQRRFESRFGLAQISSTAGGSPGQLAPGHPAPSKPAPGKPAPSRATPGQATPSQPTPSQSTPSRRDLDVALLVPETYMNRSGIAVAEALRSLPSVDIRNDLLIVVDDLDLPFGRLRIRPHGGSAGHRGLEDIVERIGSSEFPRLRFGIGRPESEIDPVDWVLDAFSSAEEDALRERIPLAAEAIGSILVDGLVPSMNRYNRGPEAGA